MGNVDVFHLSQCSEWSNCHTKRKNDTGEQGRSVHVSLFQRVGFETANRPGADDRLFIEITWPLAKSFIIFRSDGHLAENRRPIGAPDKENSSAENWSHAANNTKWGWPHDLRYESMELEMPRNVLYAKAELNRREREVGHPQEPPASSVPDRTSRRLENSGGLWLPGRLACHRPPEAPTQLYGGKRSGGLRCRITSFKWPSRGWS